MYCWYKIVDQTSESLTKGGIPLQEILADTNYSSGDALRYLEGKNIGSLHTKFWSIQTNT